MSGRGGRSPREDDEVHSPRTEVQESLTGDGLAFRFVRAGRDLGWVEEHRARDLAGKDPDDPTPDERPEGRSCCIDRPGRVPCVEVGCVDPHTFRETAERLPNLVPEPRFELERPCGPRSLSPLRLPVPPLRQGGHRSRSSSADEQEHSDHDQPDRPGDIGERHDRPGEGPAFWLVRADELQRPDEHGHPDHDACDRKPLR
jgi:hypothetical protein